MELSLRGPLGSYGKSFHLYCIQSYTWGNFCAVSYLFCFCWSPLQSIKTLLFIYFVFTLNPTSVVTYRLSLYHREACQFPLATTAHFFKITKFLWMNNKLKSGLCPKEKTWQISLSLNSLGNSPAGYRLLFWLVWGIGWFGPVSSWSRYIDGLFLS